jgi:TP901 family phage tail tape measure protein
MANLVVGALRVLLSLDSADYDQAVVRVSRSADQIQRSFKSVGRQATQLGQTLTLGLTLPMAGIAKEAIGTGTKFESAINQIKGVLQPTADQMDVVRKTAMKLGADTVFSATDAADAMLELGKAGFNTQDAIRATADVLQLAAASSLSMGDAATLAARTLNAFGLKTTDLSHVNDVLAAAVNKSSLEIGDLQVAFGYVAPIATSFGLSIEQTSAALAIMRDRGIAAETTGRAMREGFSRLVNPVKDVQQVMEQLGIETFRTADGAMMDLSDIIGLLHDRGLTAGQALKLFGDAAGPGMYALVSAGAPALDQLTTELQTSHGAAQAMADAMMSGLPGAAERMRGSIETAWLSVSKAIEPTVVRLMNLVGDLADLVATRLVPIFSALPGPVKTGAVVLAALGAAAGPIIYVFGQLATAVSVTAGVFGTGTVAAGALTTALSLLGPAVAVAAVAFAGWKLGEKIGEVTGLTDAIQHATERLMGYRDASVPLEQQQRVINLAIDKGAASTIGYADALKYLQNIAAIRRGETMHTIAAQREAVQAELDLGRITQEQAAAKLAALDAEQRTQDAMRQHAAAATSVAAADAKVRVTAEAQAAAQKKAADALEAAARQADAERSALEQLGIVTATRVSETLQHFAALEAQAVKEGVPLDAVLEALKPRLEDLATAARRSGVDVSAITAEIARADAATAAWEATLPQLRTTSLSTFPDIGRRISLMNDEQVAAYLGTLDLTTANQRFGTVSRDELQKTADESVRLYGVMLESGKYTPDQIARAFNQMSTDVQAAQGALPVQWTDVILPGVQSSLSQLGGHLTSTIGDMLTRLQGFSDGWGAIWTDMRQTASQILSQLLDYFINSFVKGILNGLAGVHGGFAAVFSGSGSGVLGTVLGGGSGAAGVSAGAGGGAAGAGALGTLGTVGTIGAEFAFPVIAGHLVNPGPLVTPPVPEDQARAAAEAYFGPDYEQYAGPGFDWSHVYPGQIPGLADGGIVLPTPGGTIARIGEAGVPEAVIPLDDDTLGGTAILEVNGRTLAEVTVPFIPGVTKRYRLA